MNRYPTFLFSLLALLYVTDVLALGEASSALKNGIDIEIPVTGGIRLTVDQVPSGDVLDALSMRLGIPIIHRRGLEELLTRACTADSVRPLLQCVLGSSANVLYSAADSKSRLNVGGYERIVVLSSSKNNAFASLGEGSGATVSVPGFGVRLDSSSAPSRDVVMTMLRNEAGDIRAEGLALLPQVEGIERETLQGAYGKALQDPDGDVRAGALMGLATLDGASTDGLAATATLDPDPSVRLAAIDALSPIPQNRSYFEQGLKDADESVRALANLRLDSLSSQTP